MSGTLKTTTSDKTERERERERERVDCACVSCGTDYRRLHRSHAAAVSDAVTTTTDNDDTPRSAEHATGLVV